MGSLAFLALEAMGRAQLQGGDQPAEGSMRQAAQPANLEDSEGPSPENGFTPTLDLLTSTAYSSPGEGSTSELQVTTSHVHKSPCFWAAYPSQSLTLKCLPRALSRELSPFRRTPAPGCKKGEGW